MDFYLLLLIISFITAKNTNIKKLYLIEFRGKINRAEKFHFMQYFVHIFIVMIFFQQIEDYVSAAQH